MQVNYLIERINSIEKYLFFEENVRLSYLVKDILKAMNYYREIIRLIIRWRRMQTQYRAWMPIHFVKPSDSMLIRERIGFCWELDMINFRIVRLFHLWAKIDAVDLRTEIAFYDLNKQMEYLVQFWLGGKNWLKVRGQIWEVSNSYAYSPVDALEAESEDIDLTIARLKVHLEQKRKQLFLIKYVEWQDVMVMVLYRQAFTAEAWFPHSELVLIR